MFRREVKSVADVLQQLLREEGLAAEAPHRFLGNGDGAHSGSLYHREVHTKSNVVCKNRESCITPGFGYDAPTAR